MEDSKANEAVEKMRENSRMCAKMILDKLRENPDKQDDKVLEEIAGIITANTVMCMLIPMIMRGTKDE